MAIMIEYPLIQNVREFGFTGSQHGMRPWQMEAFVKALTYLSAGPGVVPTLHQGMCIGADIEANAIALALGFHTTGHPPLNQSKMARMHVTTSEPAYEYLVRNRHIVEDSKVLIAAPSGPEVSQPRSGTWATKRYADRIGRPVIVLPWEE